MNNASYIITSGWWCKRPEQIDTRDKTYGDDHIRTQSFFDEWYKALSRYTSADKILIVDSDSPVKPPLPDNKNVEWLNLDCNAGHSTNHIGKLCGYTRAVLAGMAYAYSCNAEYWVYIEQDALIHGENIIEHCIEQMDKKIMFGSGSGTPQPIQQSFMIVHRDEIPGFINRLAGIDFRDNEISPEVKFTLAASKLYSLIPHSFLYLGSEPSKVKRKIFKRSLKLLTKFRNYDVLPIGYGRSRPINFNDACFYFQHGTSDELASHRTLQRQ